MTRIENKGELDTLRSMYAEESKMDIAHKAPAPIVRKLINTIDWLLEKIDETSQDLQASAEPFDRGAGKLLATKRFKES